MRISAAIHQGGDDLQDRPLVMSLRPPKLRLRKPCGRLARQRGMSLLEMLAVLAIGGLLIAVTAPVLDRYLAALEFRSQTREIGRDIARMRVTALLERRLIYFPQTDAYGQPSYEGLSAPLPDDWEIEGDPVIFLKTGACLGSVLTLTAPNGRSARLDFEPPLCRYVVL